MPGISVAFRVRYAAFAVVLEMIALSTAHAGLPTQGEKEYCVVGGSCHPTLQAAEAELKTEPVPAVGRQFLGSPDTSVGQLRPGSGGQ